MLQVKISEAEIQMLNYERYCYPCPHVQKRIYAVYLKATRNMSNEEIGKVVGLCRDSVDDWIRIYHEKGLKGLYKFNYGTTQSDLELHAESIIDYFKQHPPLSAKEAKFRIEQMTGISRSLTQVRAFMKRHGMKYLKAGHIPAKADTEKQQEWANGTLNPAIEEAKNHECHLLFMDAAHFIMQPFICALWCITRIFIKAASGRNRINVLGVINAVTKEVLTISNTTYISAETVVDFLKKIRTHYCDLPVKIVLDNARYQHCEYVVSAAKTMGITLLFLPSYSPNLNIIERLWKFTKKTILYSKFYETPKDFHNAITGFFETINDVYSKDLGKLATLKFQFFNKSNFAEICTD